MLVLVLAPTLAAARADANPIAGASYSGVAANGAGVTFTVSADGTLVNSYRITPVAGDACMFLAEGDNSVWQGAPIVAGSFEYQLYDAILFQGSFPGAQSAAGTFRLYNHATSVTPACDTGIVSWTATTTSTPPPPGAGGSGRKPPFVTRVALRRVSRTKLGGRITSSNVACRSRRTVILWRGSRRIASTRSKLNGTFSFARSKTVRGHRVRASSPMRSVPAGVCAAGSSTFIKA